MKCDICKKRIKMGDETTIAHREGETEVQYVHVACMSGPQCFVCGLPLTNEHDIRENCHVDCQTAYDIQEELKRADWSPANPEQVDGRWKR